MTGEIEPDTKDWTWVLERACAACGFDPAQVEVTHLPDLIRANTRGWDGVLESPGARVRPDASTWSPLEYACHVRDVHELFGQRVRLMLTHDNPVFDNWDQDQTAVERNYAGADPQQVAIEVIERAAETAAIFAGVGEGGAEVWERRGRRSNGSVFTVATLGAYYLHDLEHHLHDIGRSRV